MRAPLQLGEIIDGTPATLTEESFQAFAALTGDRHPIHYDADYAARTSFGKPLAHGLLLASLTALGATQAVDRIEGFVFVEQGCRFLRPAVIGDTLAPRLTVERLWEEGKRRYVRLGTRLTNQRGELVLEGFHVYQIITRGRLGGCGA